MNKKYNFISSLPRSGTSLLTCILNQNPKMTMGLYDPLYHSVTGIMEAYDTLQFRNYYSNQEKTIILRSFFDSFYRDSNEICFNNSKEWAASTALLKDLFPNFKMIVCVRNFEDIMNSFEYYYSNSPYVSYSQYKNIGRTKTVYERCDLLMGKNEPGYLSQAMKCIKQAMYSNHNDNICYIKYDSLVSNTKSVLSKLYDFFEEPYFEHNLEYIEGNIFDKYDAAIASPGLHKVKSKIETTKKKNLLPPELYNTYSKMSFWKHDDSLKNLNWLD